MLTPLLRHQRYALGWMSKREAKGAQPMGAPGWPDLAFSTACFHFLWSTGEAFIGGLNESTGVPIQGSFPPRQVIGASTATSAAALLVALDEVVS